MKRSRSHVAGICFLVLAFVLLLVVACGPAATPTPTPAPTPTPTSVPMATATPTPTAAPTPTPTAAPAARPVAGSRLVAAVPDVGPAQYYGYQLKWPYSTRNTDLGVGQSLLEFDGVNLGPLIASSWSVDDKGVTYKIRQGVPFHGGWGTVTADDVAFSFNDTIREGNLHTMAGNVTTDFSKIEALDQYTIRFTFKSKPTIRWSMGTRTAGNGIHIQSKKAFDEKGADWMLLNDTNTGPYTVTEHVADDHIYLEAVPNHWYKTGAFQTIRVLEIPEQSARTAMIKTGEADIVQIGIPFLDDIKGVSGVRMMLGRVGGTTGSSIFPAGQYYLKPEWPWAQGLPWVGDPSSPASMEAAANVRKALSYAIDRQAIIDTILKGQGCAQYLYRVDSCNPNWDHKRDTPYDVNKAKDLLRQAGYPNGFSFTYFIPTGLNPTLEEVGEAIAPMWEAIGLKPTIQKTAYSARRPEMLARTIKDVWIFIHGDSTTPDEAVPQMGELGGEGTWNSGINRPESLLYRDKVLFDTDFATAWKDIASWLDWQTIEQPVVQAVTWRDGWAVGPKVASWDDPLHDFQWPNYVWNIEPAR